MGFKKIRIGVELKHEKYGWIKRIECPCTLSERLVSLGSLRSLYIVYFYLYGLFLFSKILSKYLNEMLILSVLPHT